MVSDLYMYIAAKLYLPKVNRSSGSVIDMWIKVLYLSPPPMFISYVQSI